MTFSNKDFIRICQNKCKKNLIDFIKDDIIYYIFRLIKNIMSK